jgi:hypothetical protein
MDDWLSQLFSLLFAINSNPVDALVTIIVVGTLIGGIIVLLLRGLGILPS